MRITVVEAVNDPDVPLMVTVTVPRLAAALAVNVNALELVAGLGEKEGVTPLGRPETES